MLVALVMSRLEFEFHFAASRFCAVNTESWTPDSRTTAVPKSPIRRTAVLAGTPALGASVAANAADEVTWSTPLAGVVAEYSPAPIAVSKAAASAAALAPL